MTNLDQDGLAALISDPSNGLDEASDFLRSQGFSGASLIWQPGDLFSVRPVIREACDESTCRALIDAISRLVRAVVAAVIEVGSHWHFALATTSSWATARDEAVSGVRLVDDLDTLRASLA